jgi:hypothetical protein
MRQSRTGFLLAVVISSIMISGQQVASGASSPTDILYARPGQLVDAGGFRLNLYCMGSGSPTVVFDSGWGDWAPAWSKVQPEIANWTLRPGRTLGAGPWRADNDRRDAGMGAAAPWFLFDYRVGAASEAAVSRCGGRKTYSERIGSEASSVVGPNSL